MSVGSRGNVRYRPAVARLRTHPASHWNTGVSNGSRQKRSETRAHGWCLRTPTCADDWTLEGGNHEWLLAVSFGDVGVTRQYPEVLTRVEAEIEVSRIAPELFRMAEVWLK